MDCLSYTPSFWTDNEDLCRIQFTDDCIWNSIPLLNSNPLNKFKDESLVRFVGMVQDINNCEIYLQNYEVENKITKEKYMKCGKFRDKIDENEIVQINSHENVHGDRHKIIMITIPGLNQWVRDLEKQTNTVDAFMFQTQKETTEGESNPNGTIYLENKPSSSKSFYKEYFLNVPIQNENAQSCIALMYDTDNIFKLNEMIEILGFLSMDPCLDRTNHDILEDEFEIQTNDLPLALVPRIHCVKYKNIKYYNPLLKTISIENNQIINLYTKLNCIFTQLLFGDNFAADYLICHLITRLYVRTEPLTLGKFTLNLSHVPSKAVPDFGDKLYEFIQLLITKSHYLPLTMDNINNLTYIPKKDYNINKLNSGLLQLSDNTHLVLDETKLLASKLEASGELALFSLANLVRYQKVRYDFDFSRMEIECDIPILVISEGTSSCPCDFQVPLNVDECSVEAYDDTIKALKYFLTPELLDELRVYLTEARHAEFFISDEISEIIQADFVLLRRRDTRIDCDDMHQLLVLTRLLSLARGVGNMDIDTWKLACNMEIERRTRIENVQN